MINWPFWLYKILFFQQGIKWDLQIYKFRSFGKIMHRSPIDSSFTYFMMFFEFGRKLIVPINCQAGYQPNAGMKLFLFHREIFDFTKWAQDRLAKREGWTNAK